MKTLILATILVSLSAQAVSSLKIEGSCFGNLPSGGSFSYTYYSNFDGCRKVSRASLKFTSGMKGIFKGKRSFTDTQDIYDLSGGHKLIFKNSTGNTSGTINYADKTLPVRCEVRDYEYADC